MAILSEPQQRYRHEKKYSSLSSINKVTTKKILLVSLSWKADFWIYYGMIGHQQEQKVAGDTRVDKNNSNRIEM